MKAYVFLADGFETVEALAPVDVLRRSGVDCKTVAVGDSLQVRSSHGITVTADLLAGDASLADGDVIILPGGYPGYVHLGESPFVAAALKYYADRQRLVAAICASPSVVAASGVYRGACVTCHTSVRDKMEGYVLQPDGVVEDGQLITAAGAGWSVEFGLTLAARLCGPDVAAKVRRAMEI
ncbi:MAG: DJ-1/PfpI family protein [Bacteroidales bacterium]|nr:DJ-1/PfpI family protein [Bacteroidales bacterium]